MSFHKESDYTLLFPKLVTMVDHRPLRSNKVHCPDILLQDKSFRRFVRVVLESRAIAGGELVMPFADTLALAVPQVPRLGDPEIHAAILRERRIKLAVRSDCLQDKHAVQHLRN